VKVAVLSSLKMDGLSSKVFGIGIIALFLIVFLAGMKLAFGQMDQDKLDAIDNLTKSLVIVCSSLGEVDTNHMILCDNLLETVDNQCEEAYFKFCLADVFGEQR